MSEKSKPDDNPAKSPAAQKPESATPPTTLGEIVHEVDDEKDLLEAEAPTIQQKVKTLLVGEAFDLKDRRVFSHISLIAFFAWVGLGADGLSSSCYGPPEAFHHLKGHEYLAIFWRLPRSSPSLSFPLAIAMSSRRSLAAVAVT